MKLLKPTLLSFVIVAGMTTIACKDAATKTSGKDKSWTQEQRKEYMQSCVSSAKMSYEQRGQTPDQELITKLCMCTGQEIEAKYAYDESSKIPAEEMRNFVLEATKKCASEQ